MVGIDATQSKELQAVILALKGADKTFQAQVRKRTQAEILPDWKTELAAAAVTPLEQHVLAATAVVRASNQNVTLLSGSKGKLRAGVPNSQVAAAVEFGGDPKAKTTYESKSRKGKTYTETRRTQVQLGQRIRAGKVVYPVAEKMIPRFASLWVQTAIRTMYDAFEGKS